MKRWVLLLPAAVFPYAALVTGWRLMPRFLNDPGLRFFNPLMPLALFWLLGEIGASAFLGMVRKAGDVAVLPGMLLTVKFAQFPGQLLLLLSVMPLLWLNVDSVRIAVIPGLYTLVCVLLGTFASGLIGLAAVRQSCRKGILSRKDAMLCSVLQFVFCADFIGSVVIYRRSKETEG